MKILFVTWDGPQVTYLESLFVPIFSRLAGHGIHFQVLQFTWGDEKRIGKSRQVCEDSGIGYEAVSIWRKPRTAGSMLTALGGSLHVRKAIKRHGIDVVMPRSILPALATMLALRGQLPMVFDADGLPLDERVDFSGLSSSSMVYRALREVEAQAVRTAAVVLTRSAKAIEILQARAGARTDESKFFVVSNGRDPEKFKPVSDELARKVLRRDLGLPEDVPLVVYAGSLGPQYCPDEMAHLFSGIRKRMPDAHWLILTGSPEAVDSLLERYPDLRDCITVRSVPPDEVPRYLACADLGLALRRQSFSMQAVAPIKLGEYLLCGLPLVATAGIGDTDRLSGDVCFLVKELDEVTQEHVADWFVKKIFPNRMKFVKHCRELGMKTFSLDRSVESYLAALSMINRGKN